MLEGFSKHGFFDLDITVRGDLDVDGHHTVEDAGIVLGNAIREAVGDKKGIRRYGYFILPMDDALALCAVDLCGRPYLQFDCSFPNAMVGSFDTSLVKEFFYAVSYSAAMNIHIKMLSGENSHHVMAVLTAKHLPRRLTRRYLWTGASEMCSRQKEVYRQRIHLYIYRKER